MIKIENITKTFNKNSRSKNTVLKNVSFELPDKGLVAIFGKSGSGKTTMLNIIGGLDKQDSGRIYIDGECTSGKVDQIRNRNMGFIFQNYYLEKGYTITEIMRNQMIIAGFTDEEEIVRRTHEVLTLVDMERYKNKQGDALSGGQKQRVAIARALIKGADIILADEPTGNLDVANTLKVMEILKQISKTKLVVLVTHEVSLIKMYADSYIQLVDGELRNDSTIETTVDYDAELQRSETKTDTVPAKIPSFEKSKSKRNGRLFSIGRIFKLFRSNSEERMYSNSNIFNRIFICVLAIVMCFFSFFTFEVLNTTIENKKVNENSVFAELGVYRILRNINTDTYETLDFFELDMREGEFSYTNVAVLSGIVEKYSPVALDDSDPIEGLYGEMPGENEVLISRELAERLKTDIRLAEMQNDNSLLLMNFNGNYRISGIIPGDSPAVYMNKVDYINFLGVYSQIGFVDKNELFLAGDYAGNTFSAEIALADDSKKLTDTQVSVEINRNSLYKMMANTSEADGKVEKANLKLATMTTALYLSDSRPLYVKDFKITRDPMTADVRICVTQEVIDNIFMYLAPNLDALGDSSECYFEITAASPEVLDTLKSILSDKGIPSIDIQAVYDARNEEIVSDSMQSMTVFFIIMLLLFFIYFFIEKSGSVKNSKEYGVYRAIGVNRSNLIFKEAVGSFVNNIIPFFLFSVIVAALIAGRYATINVAFTGFIAIVGISFVASAALMMLISVIPYLFVLFKTPSQILASYDI